MRRFSFGVNRIAARIDRESHQSNKLQYKLIVAFRLSIDWSFSELFHSFTTQQIVNGRISSTVHDAALFIVSIRNLTKFLRIMSSNFLASKGIGSPYYVNGSDGDGDEDDVIRRKRLKLWDT